MKTIKEITWNWQPSVMESNGDRIDVYSDTCESAKVGENGVLKITEYFLDAKCWWEIWYEDKTVQIFNPNTIIKY